MQERKANKVAEQPHVSFIVPTLNEEVLLERLLISLSGQLSPNLLKTIEVIVVDAHSTDRTVEIAKSYGCHVIYVDPGPVSASRNAGAAQAKGEILAFIDADCELPASWLSKVLAALDNAAVVAVGASLSEASCQNSKLAQTWFAIAHRKNSVQSTALTPWLATFNLAVRKSAFNAVGGFNTALVTCEDVEFSYRLAVQGKLIQLNDCSVIHHGESHTFNEFYRREAWRARGTMRVLKTHWRNLRELASTILPIVTSCCLLTSAVLLALTFASIYTRNNLWPVFFVGFAITGPFLMMLLAYIKGVRTSFWYSAFVLALYFLARTHGTLMPFKRVDR